MKPNKLMIGDIVLVNNTPLQIAALGTAKAGFIDAKGEMFYQYYENIEPIPLTEEILKRNGFDTSDSEVKQYHFAEDGQSYHFSLRQMYNQKDNKPNGYSFYAFNVLTIIDYVHELQHAMKLCGITQKIEL